MVNASVQLVTAFQAAGVMGELDANVKQIEKPLQVSLLYRDGEIRVSGEEAVAVDCACAVLETLKKTVDKGEPVTPQLVGYAIDMVTAGERETLVALEPDTVCITAAGKPIKAKTAGQQQYVDAVRSHTVTFGIGPAGTGKTYLAVALAVNAFRQKQVNRIILTRPAVEAGEKLGFLPGDLQNKVDPYLRPLYDALHEMMGPDTYQRYLEKNAIEVAPLAYMRGRTLDDSFIILDEAQNTTPEQMKMFLTRLGFNSRAVITGDVTQIDLPDGKRSGLVDACKILDGIEDLAICRLSDWDVIRHRLVQRIIQAYEKHSRRS